MACTLDSLTSNPHLKKRSFDVVIIDEVASANVANVIFAGAKADETLALVGDFLQNAPIADSEDPITEEEKNVVDWQKSDIFALNNITDSETAKQHPRCIEISKQYRYPSVIADVVNEFCYNGILETHNKSSASDGIIVTFVNTATKNIICKAKGTSWFCPETITTALAVAKHVVEKNEGFSLGYVSPYAHQADAMSEAAKKYGLSFEAGTSHKFQGREFDTVIFDLMQHDKHRWVSLADIGGSERDVSAAKLLNVALTRAKKQLFLIGNWDLVKGSEVAGMKALANLENHPNFSLQDVRKWVEQKI